MPLPVLRPWAACRLVWLSLVTLTLAACAGAPTTTRDAVPATPAAPAASSGSTPPDTALPPAALGIEPCPAPEDRRFIVRPDGERITGFRRGSGRRVVVLTHQSRGTPCDLSGLAAALDDAGYRVVAWTSDSGASVRALRLLVRDERRRGAAYVALVGASLGAATSIVAAGATSPPVDAVVALSAASQAQVAGDVLRAAGRYRGPVMAVAGQRDPSFAELPPRLAQVHSGPELVEVVAGSGDHGKDFVRRRTDPMVARVLAFLRSARGLTP